MTDTPQGIVDKPKGLGTIYIAGPMRGLPEFNFPAFMQAERHLQALGWETRNPAAKDEDAGFNVKGTEGADWELEQQGFDVRAAIEWDLLAVIWDCDAVILLPGWKQSAGSKAELALARFLDLDVYEYDKHSSNGRRALGKVSVDV